MKTKEYRKYQFMKIDSDFDSDSEYVSRIKIERPSNKITDWIIITEDELTKIRKMLIK